MAYTKKYASFSVAVFCLVSTAVCAKDHALTCSFHSEVSSIAPKIKYIMDDTKFGQMTVIEPSGTFNAKSFMDGHILYILEEE